MIGMILLVVMRHSSILGKKSCGRLKSRSLLISLKILYVSLNFVACWRHRRHGRILDQLLRFVILWESCHGAATVVGWMMGSFNSNDATNRMLRTFIQVVDQFDRVGRFTAQLLIIHFTFGRINVVISAVQVRLSTLGSIKEIQLWGALVDSLSIWLIDGNLNDRNGLWICWTWIWWQSLACLLVLSEGIFGLLVRFVYILRSTLLQ